MSNNKVTFILGAGASAPYAFPTGQGLVKSIAEHFQYKDIYQTELGWGQSDINKFKQALNLSGLNSIDTFLERHDKYMEIGRFAIAHEIGKNEHISNVFTYENNWYRYIFNRLKYRLEDFYNGRISFITFNYDRSLEAFFENALRYCEYGHSLTEGQDRQLTEKLRAIKIIHVYGQAGLLPWQNITEDVSLERQYLNNFNLGYYWQSSRQIHLIRNKENINDNFASAQNLINESNHLYMIGFGFDEVNVKRLNLTSPLNKASIIKATAYQLGESIKNKFQHHLLSAKDRDKIKWGGYDQTIINFLEQHLTEF